MGRPLGRLHPRLDVGAGARGLHDDARHCGVGPARRRRRRTVDGHRTGAARHDRISDQPALLPAPECPAGLAERQSARRPRSRHPYRWGIDRRTHGAVRLGADPRSRDTRGDGAHPHQRESGAAPTGGAQADLERGQHRFGRAVRGGGAHHPDRRRPGLGGGSALSPHGGTATRAPRGGSGRRDERSVRNARSPPRSSASSCWPSNSNLAPWS